MEKISDIPPVKRLTLALAILAVVIALIRILNGLRAVPSVYEHLIDITAVLLILPPLVLSFVDRDRLDYISVDKKDLLVALKWFLIVSLVIFPVVVVGNHFYQKIFFNSNFHAARMESFWATYALSQLFGIAIPEEFFFRGFLQNSIDNVVPAKRTFFGTPYGIGDLITAAIFALAHSLIALAWWHAFIFFPALVFSWLKKRTSTIWAGALFHWICNLFSYAVYLHYS